VLAKPRKLQSQAANTISNTNADTIPTEEWLSVSRKGVTQNERFDVCTYVLGTPDGNRFVGIVPALIAGWLDAGMLLITNWKAIEMLGLERVA